uniref:MULE transposase domain-containing protein n=1 Tax=Lactuca sativa TaxID=4236 RepID=A0A9R1X159_LACSA|nr:hypothetical protein LSAT_V11C700375310 [Lactuca sativa]
MMFLEVGMDGNNQILPIAFGVGKIKSGESWIWFLSRLKECNGDMPSLAIISDRANSIEITIQVVFPNAYQKLYCRYLLMNMRTKIDKQERKRFCFGKLQKLTDSLISKKAWVGYVVHQMKIVVQNQLREMGKVVFSYETIQQWWCQRHNVGAESKKDITEYAKKVYQIDQSRYEVTDQMKNGKEKKWNLVVARGQFSGTPYSHAMTVFNELRYHHYSTWMPSYFTMKTYRSTYIEVVFHVPVSAEYEQPYEVMVVLPPLMDKRQAE